MNKEEDKKKERIEILKEIIIKGNLVKKMMYYTGVVSEYDHDNILIETDRDEKLIFRKSQVQSRMLVDGDDKDGNKKTG